MAFFCVIGLVRTVVSISHCGCDDPGSIPGLDSNKGYEPMRKTLTTVRPLNWPNSSPAMV